MTDESLFSAALALPPAARPAFLAARCPDPVVRKQVEDLLAAADASNPLDRPPPDLDRTNSRASSTASVESTAAVGDRVGPYKLLEKIGEGGMGEVWVADQQEPIKRRVALKLIKPGMDSRSVLGRFEAERQALAVMDHPNIAKVLDAGTTADGRPFFVMELVKGTPITEFADARKLTPKQRLELFVPVCQAIQHAHMKGIIHRDIKPSNVLVALHDETPVPKVIDFGVAKAVGQQLTDKTIYTGFGALVGTPAYMAPEQATFNQLDVDTRADVYALGVVLYELLAGSPPIEKERLRKAALDEMLRMVREEEPPRPSHRLSTSQAKATIAATRGSEPAKLSALMKGELDWIVMKALEKDRTRRYETANGLAKDVERYLHGEQVQAVPPSLGYRLRKAYRRNKAAVWVAAAFAGLILGAAVMGGYLAVTAEQARRGEAAERHRAVQRENEANDQRKRAEAEQRRAEEEKRAAEAVRAFLQDDLLKQASVFEQANSRSLTGGDLEIKPNPTINELLDRAAVQLAPERIGAKFPALPFVQAEVLHAVATAYFGLSEYAKAVALIDRAVPLYLATRGPDDRATLGGRVTQAMAHREVGRPEDGERMLAAAAADCRRVLGPRDRMGFEASVWHGRSIAMGSRPADAIPFFQKLKAEGAEYYGASDTLALVAAGHLAMAYRLAGQPAVAIREMEEVLAGLRAARVRPDHPWLYAAFGELADAYAATNRPDKAAEVWRDLLGVWAERGEPYHPSSWRIRHELAWLHGHRGETEVAAKLFEENLKAAREPKNTLYSYEGLVRMELKQEKDDAALAHARLGLDAILAGQPPGFRSWQTGLARLCVSRALLKKDRTAAEPVLAAAFRDLADFHDKRPPWDAGEKLGEAQRALTARYRTTGQAAEAARVAGEYRAVLDRAGQGTGDAEVRTGNGWEVFNAGDHAAAAELFEAAAKAATSPEAKSKAYHGLFLSEQKLGKLDAAREHARAAVDVIVTARGPDHRSYPLGQARSALGLLLSELKEPAAAEPHLVAGCREVADFPDQIPAYDFPHRHVPFDHLTRILEGSNRPAEAKKWLAVRQELLDKLMRKTLAGDKFTASTVTMVGQQVQTRIEGGWHDDAIALYRELGAKYKPADKPAADAWLRLSATVINGYTAANKPDEAAKWKKLSEAK